MASKPGAFQVLALEHHQRVGLTKVTTFFVHVGDERTEEMLSFGIRVLVGVADGVSFEQAFLGGQHNIPFGIRSPRQRSRRWPGRSGQRSTRPEH